jgi:hypothetical protein
MWKRYISKARKEGVDFGLSKWTEENERATMAQVELRSSLSQDPNISTRYNPLADVSRMPANLQEEARASIITSKQELLLATRPRSDRNIGADNNSGDGYYGGGSGDLGGGGGGSYVSPYCSHVTTGILPLSYNTLGNGQIIYKNSTMTVQRLARVSHARPSFNIYIWLTTYNMLRIVGGRGTLMFQ